MNSQKTTISKDSPELQNGVSESGRLFVSGGMVGARIMSDDPGLEGLEGVPEPVICECCGKVNAVEGFVMPSRIIWAPYGARCDCEGSKKKRAEEEKLRKASEEAEKKLKAAELEKRRIESLIGQSGMGERFLRRTFETFEVNDANRKAFEYAKNFAEHFDKLGSLQSRNGLFFSGGLGTGKTHLAAAIANDLLSKGHPVICMTMIDLLDRIKRTFRERTFRERDCEEGEVLELYKRVALLVIDDIGKELPTDWALSTIYNIVNGRYEANLPIIVTTNYTGGALVNRMTPRDSNDVITAMATVDRLVEMCVGVNIAGESWRQK